MIVFIIYLTLFKLKVPWTAHGTIHETVRFWIIFKFLSDRIPFEPFIQPHGNVRMMANQVGVVGCIDGAHSCFVAPNGIEKILVLVIAVDQSGLGFGYSCSQQ
jgi:hypothetical protein